MNTIELTRKIRIESLKMVAHAKASHISSAFSCVEILAVLYNEILKFQSSNPSFLLRDRFILSKGHACVSLYATLALKNFFHVNSLKNYAKKNSVFMTHASHKVPGVEFSSGSLGQGLPFAVGKAYFAKINNKNWRTYVLLSDGELNEGSNWESIFFAAHHNLKNLNIIIDNNKLQGMDNTSEIQNIHRFISKVSYLGYDVIKVNGHDLVSLKKAFKKKSTKPKFIIAETIKGKGLKFMENDNLWHYKNPSVSDLPNLIKQINNYYEK